jgi:uncharacterized RDD family membrane protein YckC
MKRDRTLHPAAIRSALALLLLGLFAAIPASAAPVSTPEKPRTQFVAGQGENLWVVQEVGPDEFTLLHRDDDSPANTLYKATATPLTGRPLGVAAFGPFLYIVYSDLSVQQLDLETVVPGGPRLLNPSQLPPLPREGRLVQWVAGAAPVALMYFDKPPAEAIPPAKPVDTPAEPAAKTPEPEPADDAPPLPPSPWHLLELKLGRWQELTWPQELADTQPLPGSTPHLLMLDGQKQQLAVLAHSEPGSLLRVYTQSGEGWTAENYDLPLSPAANAAGVSGQPQPGAAVGANLVLVQSPPGNPVSDLAAWVLRDGKTTSLGTLGPVPPDSRWWITSSANRLTLIMSDATGRLRWTHRQINAQEEAPPLVPLSVVEEPLNIGDPLTLAFLAAMVIGTLFLLLTTRRDLPARIPKLLGDQQPSGAVRIAAAFIDLAPAVGLSSFLLGLDSPLVILEHWPGPSSDWRQMAPAAVAIAFHVAHTTLTELFTGATLGKLLMGCRVVNLAGGPPHVWQVLVRNLFKAMEMVAPPLLVLAVINPFQQRLGDLVARTVVVSHRNPAKPKDPADDLDDFE